MKKAGLSQDDINLIELNEAFASQSLAVIKEANINPEITNINDFKYEDFDLINYDPHPHIKAAVSV